MRIAYWPVVPGIVLSMAVLTGPSAQASETPLCSGCVSCTISGKSDAGYGLVSSIADWAMTTGHYCTNYLPYRPTHGRLVARPENTGMAGT